MQKFCKPKSSLRKFRNPIYTLRKFLQPHTCLAKIFATPYLPCKNFANPFCLAKPMRNLKSLCKLISQPCKFQRSLCEIPTVSRKAKGHLKSLFKDLQSLSFRTLHSPLRKPFTTLWISFLSSGRLMANHLKRRPTPLAPFWPWYALEEAIPTLQYFTRPDQEPPLLRIHLRPLKTQPFSLLREGCHLTLLRADTRHGDHRLLNLLSH